MAGAWCNNTQGTVYLTKHPTLILQPFVTSKAPTHKQPFSLTAFFAKESFVQRPVFKMT
jgi:hypothetical protein